MAYNLKYYFTYYSDKDVRQPLVAPDEHLLEIRELDYADIAIEIQASESPVIINYQNVGDNKLEAFRGSEVTLNLIATEDFQLEDLYTENERQFLILDYRNGDLIGQWFIIPDGCQESFSFPPYQISINGVDGLGLLKNFAYVQPGGGIWAGKNTFLDVIFNCLNRLELDYNVLNTCCNIYEVTMLQGNYYDPLDMCYVNNARYFQADGYTPMNCQEVLLSILEEWTACIIMSEGEWWIYRPSEVAATGDLVFRRYVDGVVNYANAIVSKDLDVLLGGESEGVVLAPLFHINTDQLKMIDRPYKNASISYKYGFVTTLIDDPYFSYFDGVDFTGWQRSDPLLIIYPGTYGGVTIDQLSPPYSTSYQYLTNINGATGAIADVFVITINYYNYDSDGPMADVVLIGATTYYLNNIGQWVLTPARAINSGAYPDYTSGAFVVTSDPLPIAGDIFFKLYEARSDNTGSTSDVRVTYQKADITPVTNASEPIGEVHMAEQTNSFTFLPPMIEVFNGDNDSEQFVGGIYRQDGTTLTTLWNRRGIPESILALPYDVSKKFLRIAVEEKVRLYGAPFVRFEGSVFGYFNPLSRFTINLIEGKFMPLSLNYDLQSNICKSVLGRVSDDEIAMNYTLSNDYGETVKVTIK